MTTPTAGPPSARPGTGRSGPLEEGENRSQVGTQVLDRLRRERASRLGLELTRSPVLLDLLTRAVDRVLLGVQEVLHEHDQLDLAPLVDTISGAVLRGIEEPELTLPVSQHVRLQVGELAHLADREEFLHGMRCAHRPRGPRRRSCPPHTSAFSSRSIKSATAWRGGLPRNSTSATSRAIGSSTPWRSASVTAERAVFTPSATVATPASASSSRRPRPNSPPSERWRDCGPVAVRIRSPIPASPANVAGSAPRATPSRVISARPRVINAARVL